MLTLLSSMMKVIERKILCSIVLRLIWKETGIHFNYINRYARITLFIMISKVFSYSYWNLKKWTTFPVSLHTSSGQEKKSNKLKNGI